MKKKNMIIILLAVLLIGGGGFIAYSFINKDDSNTNKQKEDDSSLSLNTFTKSKETDNIAIPFQTSDGFYVIDLEDKGIGEKMEFTTNNDSYEFKNDKISISHFYNISIGGTSIRNLFGFDKVTISVHTSNVLPVSSKYATFETVKNDGNYYLVSSLLTNSSSPTYSVYVVSPNQKYSFSLITDNTSDLEKATDLYNKLLNSSSIAFVKYNDDNEFQGATVEKDSSTKVDVSKWRFFPDMLLEYFRKNDLAITSSIRAYNFNHKMRGEVYFELSYKINEDAYKAGFTITEVTKDKYEDTVKDKTKIDLKGYDSAYIYSLSNNANMYVQTDSKYYRIETGIAYAKESNEEHTNKVIDIFNQVFAK